MANDRDDEIVIAFYEMLGGRGMTLGSISVGYRRGLDAVEGCPHGVALLRTAHFISRSALAWLWPIAPSRAAMIAG